MSRNSKGFVQVLVVVLLLVLVGGAAYYFGTQKGNLSFNLIPTPTPVGSSQPLIVNPTPKSTADPTANWKTFVTKDGKFSFKYPRDWILIDNSKNTDLYGDGKLQFQQDITISKGEYKFMSRNPLAWGPNICLYPDSASFEGPSAKYTSYVQIEGASGIFRRAKADLPPEVKNDFVTWSVCTKAKDSNTYTSVAGFGIASYQSPLSYDESLVKIMDQIMASLKSL